jgi:hypothetical protein
MAFEEIHPVFTRTSIPLRKWVQVFFISWYAKRPKSILATLSIVFSISSRHWTTSSTYLKAFLSSETLTTSLVNKTTLGE